MHALVLACGVWHNELDASLHQAIKGIANEELGDGIASAINM